MNLSRNNTTPVLDLHGESRNIGLVMVKEFIEDNYKIGRKEIIIMHGLGLGIMKEMVHKELKVNKMVKDFKVDPNNLGNTIVYLSVD